MAIGGEVLLLLLSVLISVLIKLVAQDPLQNLVREVSVSARHGVSAGKRAAGYAATAGLCCDELCFSPAAMNILHHLAATVFDPKF